MEGLNREEDVSFWFKVWNPVMIMTMRIQYSIFNLQRC